MMDTETENESTGNEMVDSSGGDSSCRPNENDQNTREQANTATEADRAGGPVNVRRGPIVRLEELRHRKNRPYHRVRI